VAEPEKLSDTTWIARVYIARVYTHTCTSHRFTHFCVVELEGIISGEGYEEATGKVLWEGAAVVVQEQ